MSTAWYFLSEPISSIRLDEGPAHDRLTIWIRGVNVGTLTLGPGEGREVARMLAETDADDARCAIHTSFGGAAEGLRVRENHRGLDPSLVLVSEYGEVKTVAEVRALAGAGKGEASV